MGQPENPIPAKKRILSTKTRIAATNHLYNVFRLPKIPAQSIFTPQP
ncbi:hypothetical protein GCWU000324_01359 [Kingella oralis ATCC 51147]|uniref:Uncharacterized protein n=1 Tax=Kingella oralis ATCC 51147 TaxID=629741 RepID=C4GGU0_9NEIS|nr:hypothetical protein GCWU000324_01359 [Kingella oralis ATCC 51147]